MKALNLEKEKGKNSHVKVHFIKRTARYNQSSNWVKDLILLEKLYNLTEPGPGSYVLDLATGTGKVAQKFHKKVKHVIGVDICKKMTDQSLWLNELLIEPAEKLSLENNSVDIVICRQGLQFMHLDTVLKEAYRVLKPGGRIVLCHLTSHGEDDKEQAFRIQKLRNPSRKNFFLPGDIPSALQRVGFQQVESFEYISRESVNQWINNGAIGDDNKAQIKALYRNCDTTFKQLHELEFVGDDIFDSMKFVIAKSRK